MTGLTKRASESRRRRVFAAAFALGALSFVWADAADAATFVVNTTFDGGGTGACGSGGSCGFRQAIAAANANLGPDVISVPAGNYALGAGGSLSVTDDVRIVGAGASATTIDASANGMATALTVMNATQAINVDLTGMTIQGATTSNNGGGIAVGASSGPTTSLALHGVIVANNTSTGGYGGGVFVDSKGSLTMDHSRITANKGPTYGGGLANTGTATVTTSLFDSNSSTYGGGIINETSGTLTLTNSTIANNKASNIAGIYTNAQASLSFDTIAGNTDTGGGYSAGYRSNATGVHMLGVIIANNTGPGEPECSFGAAAYYPVSDGYNIDDSNTCQLAGTGDVMSLDPQLGSLQDNGGPTLTRALKPGSPAIGTARGCPTLDQRGGARPAGGPCDRGAYQANALADLAVTGGVNPTATTVGQTATYTFTATNRGPDAIAAVQITDQLPAGATLLSAPAGCTGATTVTCPLGSMAVGANTPLTLVARLNTPGQAVDTASISGAPTDPNPADDSVTLMTAVSALPLPLPLPPLPAAAPTLTGLALLPPAFRAAASGPSIAARTKTGTQVSFALDRPATVVFAVQRAQRGRLVGKRCLPARRERKIRRACSRTVTLRGSFQFAGHAGANTLRFTGSLARHRLARGAYTLVATPTAASRPGAPTTARFRIIP